MEAENVSSLHYPGTYESRIALVFGTDITGFANDFTVWQSLILLFCFYWGASSFFVYRRIRIPGAPVHGYRSWFEPTFLFQLRYAWDAHKIISSGYEKYKNTPFVLRRQDLDINVLPNKYIPELRTIPNTKLSRGKANSMEWGDQWAMKTLWSHSEYTQRAISDNRKGQLSRYIDSIKEELEYAFEAEMPPVDDWTEVDIQHIIRMILVRLVGKMIVGHPSCRSPEWLDLGENFTEDFVGASLIMRLLPSWTHFLATNIIPQRWRLRRWVRRTQKIVGPVIARHEDAVSKRALGIDVEEDDTMMNWMMNNEEDKDYILKNMATLVLIILVPAAHTSAMAISSILFELCAHPEWDAKLRTEIREVTDKFGKIGEIITTKDWLSKLELLDSFFNESQRVNQPLAITPNRYATEEFSFKDGLRIPKGALIGWVSIHNQIDHQITPDPKLFDPMRSYRKRHSAPEEEGKHLAGHPSLDNLSFGFGSQACPGRHIAVNVVKMVVSRILVDYQFKFAEGNEKPSAIHLLEFIFPDPSSKLMMRKRRDN